MKRKRGAVALALAGTIGAASLALDFQLAQVSFMEEPPLWGNFYSLQKTGDPPLPFNPFPELPLYWLGEGVYAFDDREVDYVALRQQWEAWWLLRQAAMESLAAEGITMETLEDEGPPGPPGYGGGGGGTNEPPYSGPPTFLSRTGLCLYPPVFLSTNVVSLTVTNGEAGAPYDLFMTTNLSPYVAGLNLTNWLWLLRGAPGQTNFTLTNVPGPEAYFRLGTTNDSDNDGLTDAFEQLVSHTDPSSASSPDTDGDGMPDAWELANRLHPCIAADATADPDDDGDTNLQEYQNRTNPFDPMLVAWSKDDTGQERPPWGLPGVVAMAGGGATASGGHTLMLTAQGAVQAWGGNSFGQTNVPGGIATNGVAVAAGGDQSAALLANGTVTTWGRGFAGVPGGLANATAIAAGYQHFLALRADGKVVSWCRSNCPANVVPAALDSVRAVSAGWNHNLALRSNGTMAVWGLNAAVLGWNLTNAPTELTDVAAISAGALHSVALRSNGTLVAWGYN